MSYKEKKDERGASYQAVGNRSGWETGASKQINGKVMGGNRAQTLPSHIK